MGWTRIEISVSSLNCVGWTAWKYRTQISFVPLCLCGNPSHTDHHKGTKSQRPHESLRSLIGNSEEPTFFTRSKRSPSHVRSPALTRAGAGLRAPSLGRLDHCRESLDSSNAITLLHKIWRARPYLYRAIRARRMDSMGRSTSQFRRIEVMTKTLEMRGRSVHIENGHLQTVTF